MKGTRPIKRCDVRGHKGKAHRIPAAKAFRPRAAEREPSHPRARGPRFPCNGRHGNLPQRRMVAASHLGSEVDGAGTSSATPRRARKRSNAHSSPKATTDTTHNGDDCQMQLCAAFP